MLKFYFQVCCMPSGNPNESADILWNLSLLLPSLHSIVIPILDRKMMEPVLQKFNNTSILINHKCNTDSVFSTWEPYH